MSLSGLLTEAVVSPHQEGPASATRVQDGWRWPVNCERDKEVSNAGRGIELPQKNLLMLGDQILKYCPQDVVA